ncbi:hypothetical protein AA313_de0208901 [Arthrobotrys entomopaga]|nr:hypothetical protein AA313_de0208901 [Arthrobotrys entomopaga]
MEQRQHQQVAATNALWQTTLTRSHKKLGARHSRFLSEIQTRGELDDYMSKLATGYTQKKIVARLTNLSGFLDTLQAYSPALNSITSAYPNPATVVWSCLQVVIKIAARYVGTLDLITGMLEDMGKRWPRYETYQTMFRSHQGVQTRFVELLCVYVNFCCATIRFFVHRPIWILIRLCWSRQEHHFKQCVRQIDKVREEIEAEAHAAHFEKSIEQHNELREAISGKPQLVVAKKSTVRMIPFPLNSSFFQRPRISLQIWDCLKPKRTSKGTATFKSFLLHGLGGSGKTQIALDFAYQHWEDYDNILWASAASDIKLAEDYHVLAQGLGIYEGSDQIQAKDCLKRWLAQEDSGRWLLILDNADEPAILKDYWPNTAHGSILVTSRDSSLGIYATTDSCYVETMESLEGSEMVLSLLKAADTLTDQRRTAMSIAEALHGLPLAISQMTSYMLETNTSMETFLRLYKDPKYEQILSDTRSASIDLYNYQHTLATVHRISLSRLDPGARHLINICAFFDPDEIPEKLLVGGGGATNTPSEVTEDIIFSKDLQAVLRHALLRRNPERSILTIHRQVQKSIVRCLSQDELVATFKKSSKVLFIYNDDDKKAEYADQIQLANCFSNLGIAYKQDKRYPEAAELHFRSLKIKERWPHNAFLLALSYDNLGKVRQLQGNLDEATRLFREAVDVYQGDLGWDSHRAANFKHSLGRALIEQGNYDDAKKSLEEALKMLDESVGNHVDTGWTSYTLGLVHHLKRDYDAARTCLSYAVEVFSEPTRYADAKLAMALNLLARVNMDSGRQRESDTQFQQACDIYTFITQSPAQGTREEISSKINSLLTSD